ncbi:MAG: DUF6691 family protein [Betaproteobacteria bacterium]
MAAFAAFVAGLVFGIGLIISGMFNPAKVLAFLDLAGNWDPSLALVMAAAVVVAGIAYAVAKQRGSTLLGTPLQLPARRGVDRPLVIGSIMFGVGWGLAGLCPAPALLVLGAGRVKGFIFVVAMLAGMGVYELIERARAQRAARDQQARLHPPAHGHGAARHRTRKA